MEFFDILPDIAFLRIFDFLPLTDRFRVGRVSQSFRRISQTVNSRIKSLRLNDEMFDELDEDQFEVILRLCRHNLRELEFSGSDVEGYMAVKLSEFPCPQLIDLDLGRVPITDDEFALIVTNHPNLKRLKWWSTNDYDVIQCDFENRFDQPPPTLYHVQFPPVTLPHLEILDIQNMNDATLERLIDRCPNLKTLTLTLDRASSEDVWDRFFQSVPRLESLRLDLYDCQILMESLESFWRLPLTSLEINYRRGFVAFEINDDFVNKLVENFTDIETLDLSLTQVSDEAVAALTRLEKLRVVNMSLAVDLTDEVIRAFAACPNLEKLRVFTNCISDETFLELFRKCPRLCLLRICGVHEGDDDDNLLDAVKVSVLVSELANVPHRPSISFHFRCLPHDDASELYSAWHSVHVQNVVDGLKQNHGIEVKICVEHNPEMDEIYDEMELENLDEEAMDVDGQQPNA